LNVSSDGDDVTVAGKLTVPLFQWRNYNFCRPPGKHSLNFGIIDSDRPGTVKQVGRGDDFVKYRYTV